MSKKKSTKSVDLDGKLFIDVTEYRDHEGLKYVTEKMVREVHGDEIADQYDSATTRFMTMIVKGQRCMLSKEYEKWATSFPVIPSQSGSQ